MSRFLAGVVVGALGGLFLLFRWLGSQPPTTTSDPVHFWGTTSDDSGQWTYTSNAPLT